MESTARAILEKMQSVQSELLRFQKQAEKLEASGTYPKKASPPHFMNGLVHQAMILNSELKKWHDQFETEKE
jgi:hypothetical protein